MNNYRNLADKFKQRNQKKGITGWFQRITKSNIFVNIVMMIIIWTVAFIPFAIYFVARAMLNPIGFWQEVATILVWAVALGWLQAIFLFFAAAITFNVIFDR